MDRDRVVAKLAEVDGYVPTKVKCPATIVPYYSGGVGDATGDLIIE